MAGKIVIDIEDLATQSLEGLDETLKGLQSDAAAPLEKALGEVEQAQEAVAESAEQLTGQVTEAAGEVEELAEQIGDLHDGMERAEKSTDGMVSGLSEVEKAATKAGQQVKQFGAAHAKQAATAGEQFTAMGRRASGFAQSVAIMVASNEQDLQKMMQSIVRVRATFQMFDDGLAAVRRLSAGIQMLQQTKQNLAAITPAVVAANQAHAASNVAVAGTAGTATGAVKTLTAAMLANPVTALLIGFAAAVTGVVAAFAYFNRAGKEADAKQRELADSARLAKEQTLSYAAALEHAGRAGEQVSRGLSIQIAHEERISRYRDMSAEALRTIVARREAEVSEAQRAVVAVGNQLAQEKQLLETIETRLEWERKHGNEVEAYAERRLRVQERINALEQDAATVAERRKLREAELAAAKRAQADIERNILDYRDAAIRSAEIERLRAEENLGVLQQQIDARRDAIEVMLQSGEFNADEIRHHEAVISALESRRKARESELRQAEDAMQRERQANADIQNAIIAFEQSRETAKAEQARQEQLAQDVALERLAELHAKEQERLKASKDLRRELDRQRSQLIALRSATGDVKEIEEQRRELAERIKQTKADIVDQDRKALEYQKAQEKIEQDRQRRAEQEAQKRQASLMREIQQRQILQQLAAQVERKDVAKQIAQQRIAAGDMPDRIAGMGGAQQERAMMQMVMAQLKKGVVPQEEIARAQMSVIEQGARQIGLNEEQLAAFREAVGIEQQQFNELQMIREALAPLQEWIQGERRPKPGRAQAGAQRGAGPEGVPMADPQAAVRGAGEAFQREIEQRGRLAEATGQLAQQQVEYAQQSASMLERTTGLLGNNTALIGRTAQRLTRVEQALDEITRSQRRTAQVAGRM